MTTRISFQQARDELLATVTIGITRAGQTRVLYESGEQPPSNIPARKAPAPDPKTPSRSKGTSTAGKAKPPEEKQHNPTDGQLKASFCSGIQAITFDSREDFQPEASDGMFKKLGKEKKYYVAQEYLERLFPKEIVRSRVLALMKDVGCIISGPHEIRIEGIKCPMYKVDLKAVRENIDVE